MNTEAAKKLRDPFPPAAIGKLPKGGVMLDYVGHAAVTDRLLQVDPDWAWEPFALTDDGLPALDKAGNLWIKLTVCGVTRPGVGDGKNAKECISDAIRNAAMRFGVALDLWAKEDLQGGSDPSPQPKPANPQPEVVVATTDSLRAEYQTLAGTWDKLEPTFVLPHALKKADEQLEKAKKAGSSQPYRTFLEQQIASYKTLIAERSAVGAAEKTFPIPAGAR